jgi:CsoR family transcriptional regulator, copper-sensing transcriptional repressor
MSTGSTTTASQTTAAETTTDGAAPVSGRRVAAPGYSDDKDQVRKRLRRIEGQVRGIQRMVEDDRYCIDVLGQVAAATSALQSVALLLLDDHLAHCVSSAVRAGGDEAEAKLAEASVAIARLVRS